jgi:hypothetical protein
MLSKIFRPSVWVTGSPTQTPIIQIWLPTLQNFLVFRLDKLTRTLYHACAYMYTVRLECPLTRQDPEVTDYTEPVKPTVDKGPPMSAVELEVVTYIEQYWDYYGHWPKQDEIHYKFPGFRLSDALGKTSFVNALVNRGIELPTFKVRKVGDLTTEMVAAVALITNFDNKMSITGKLKTLGISMTKYQGWLKNPVFKNYLHKVSADRFEDDIHRVHAGLLKAVDKGSVEATKFYLEYTGRYVPGTNTPEIQNLKLVIAKLMEAIQQTIKDPLQLSELNVQFENIMSGTPNKMLEAAVDTALEDL